MLSVWYGRKHKKKHHDCFFQALWWNLNMAEGDLCCLNMISCWVWNPRLNLLSAFTIIDQINEITLNNSIVPESNCPLWSWPFYLLNKGFGTLPGACPGKCVKTSSSTAWLQRSHCTCSIFFHRRASLVITTKIYWGGKWVIWCFRVYVSQWRLPACLCLG